MSTSVKFFHSGMPGALRANTGTSGINLVGFSVIFRQCLVTGFNFVTPTALTVLGEVATASLPSGHGFQVNNIVLIQGASPSGLNGEFRVVTSAANAITFAAPGIDDGVATGAISVSYAPAGWVEPFVGGGDSGSQYRVFRSSDPTSTGMFAQTHTASATRQTIRGYEAMTAINTGTGSSDLVHAYVNDTTNKVSGPWVMFADAKTCYFFQGQTDGVSNSGAAFCFGDFKSFAPVDPYAFFVTGLTQNAAANSEALIPGSWDQWPFGYLGNNTNVEFYVTRSSTGAGGWIKPRLGAEAYTAGADAGMSGALVSPLAPTYPNPANNSFLLSRMLVSEAGIGLRGFMRGLYVTPHNNHASFTQLQTIEGQGSFAGRKLMVVKPGATRSSTSFGLMLVDITGPWE
jgi:hypothetical protein